MSEDEAADLTFEKLPESQLWRTMVPLDFGGAEGASPRRKTVVARVFPRDPKGGEPQLHCFPVTAWRRELVPVPIGASEEAKLQFRFEARSSGETVPIVGIISEGDRKLAEIVLLKLESI